MAPIGNVRSTLPFWLILQSGAFPTDKIAEWISQHPHLFEPELDIPISKPLMKGSLINRTFPMRTGGMPVTCGGSTCTVSFCWEAAATSAHCLTAYHLWAAGDHVQFVLEVGNSTKIRIPGVHAKNSSTHDWVVFEVSCDRNVYDGGIHLMDGFDRIEVVGYSRPLEAEAVWKLGAFTGMSVGRIVEVDQYNFKMDGIDGDEGDSGGAVCSGESFNQCILLGMVVRGDNKARTLEAVRADHVVGSILGMPLHFRNRTGDALAAAEKLAAELRAEKAELRAEKAAAEKLAAELRAEAAAEKLAVELRAEKAERRAEVAELKLEMASQACPR